MVNSLVPPGSFPFPIYDTRNRTNFGVEGCMSSGESTNVLANAAGESTFGQNDHNSISLILIHWMVIYLLGCAIQHLNNWSQCCLATLHGPVSKKQTTTTQRMQKNTKAGIQRQMRVSVVSYTTFCSSNQLYRGRRKYCYCIKICCNQFI